jgi:transporter family-2 protein
LGRAGWILLGVVAGAVLPVQGAVNAELRHDLRQPFAVGLVSFCVATLTISAVLAVLLLLRRTPTPRFGRLNGVPWWGWLGGLCAATYVVATFLLIPAIGAATTVALTVTGQQAASAVIDHRGLFALPRRPLTVFRLVGLGLLVSGSLLIQLG